jgi:hypothetical protein
LAIRSSTAMEVTAWRSFMIRETVPCCSCTAIPIRVWLAHRLRSHGPRRAGDRPRVSGPPPG